MRQYKKERYSMKTKKKDTKLKDPMITWRDRLVFAWNKLINFLFSTETMLYGTFVYEDYPDLRITSTLWEEHAIQVLSVRTGKDKEGNPVNLVTARPIKRSKTF